MYAEGNPKTKKQLREWISAGVDVFAFQPGPFPPQMDGVAVIEGPQYPRPHRWAAEVRLEEGLIVEVLS